MSNTTVPIVKATLNLVYDRGKKPSLIVKTWERCKSIGRRRVVTPEGCFSVYVGPERERFMVKTEYVNHPLFRVLLDQAESEFGYTSDGPIVLPCDVVLFKKVLLAVDDDDVDEEEMIGRLRCGGCSPYRILTPPRMVVINQF